MRPLYKGMQTTLLVMSLGGIMAGCQQEIATPAPSVQDTTHKTSEAVEPKLEKEPIKTDDKTQVTKQEETKSPPTEFKQQIETPASAEDKPAKTTEADQAVPVKAPSVSPSPPTSASEAAKVTETVPVKQQTVTLSIIGDEQAGTILNATQIEIEDGDTVLDVLKKATKKHNIQLEYRGTGSLAYVEGINNLYEFDHGSKSGWMYRVNGVFGKSSAGHIAIKPNDQLEWVYTLDLGKDLE